MKHKPSQFTPAEQVAALNYLLADRCSNYGMATALIAAREFYSETEKRTLYMADGPDATSKSLLARGTPEDAIRDGLEYFLRTRKQNSSGDWTIVA